MPVFLLVNDPVQLVPQGEYLVEVDLEGLLILENVEVDILLPQVVALVVQLVLGLHLAHLPFDDILIRDSGGEQKLLVVAHLDLVHEGAVRVVHPRLVEILDGDRLNLLILI